MSMQLAISIADARNDLPSISKQALRGEPIVITRHGRPESVLLSYAEYRRLAPPAPAAVRRAAVVLAGRGGRQRPGGGLMKGARRLTATLRAAGVARILLVSDDARIIAMRALPEGVTAISACNRNRGFASSLKRALRFIDGECDPVLIAFASRPEVRPSTVRSLFERYERAGRKPAIVSPVRAARRGHPVLISGRLVPEVLRMDPRWGLASLVRRHEGELVEVEVGDRGILASG